MHKLTLILCVIGVSLSAQWLNYPTAGIPRLADGKPNLTAPAPRASDGKGTPSRHASVVEIPGVWFCDV